MNKICELVILSFRPWVIALCLLWLWSKSTYIKSLWTSSQVELWVWASCGQSYQLCLLYIWEDVQARKRSLTRNPACWCLDLGLQPPELLKRNVFCWKVTQPMVFFVRPAWRDGDTVPGVCYVFMFGCAGSSLLCVGLLWVQRVGSSLGCVQASRCSGFSGCGVQSLGTVGSVVVTHRLNSTNLQALERGLRGCGAWT